MSERALRELAKEPPIGEAQLLAVFDNNHDRICSVAAKVFAGGPRGSYEIDVSDF